MKVNDYITVLPSYFQWKWWLKSYLYIVKYSSNEYKISYWWVYSTDWKSLLEWLRLMYEYLIDNGLLIWKNAKI